MEIGKNIIWKAILKAKSIPDSCFCYFIVRLNKVFWVVAASPTNERKLITELFHYREKNHSITNYCKIEKKRICRMSSSEG